MSDLNSCPRCGGQLEAITFGHRRDRFAIWCPSCNQMWQPHDCQPEPGEPEPPQGDPLTVIHARELKTMLLRHTINRAAGKAS